jgi:hypothetical protein
MLMRTMSKTAKARRCTAVSAVLLALGLCLFLFVHPATQHGLDALHAIVGVCLGASGALGAMAVMLRLRGRG